MYKHRYKRICEMVKLLQEGPCSWEELADCLDDDVGSARKTVQDDIRVMRRYYGNDMVMVRSGRGKGMPGMFQIVSNRPFKVGKVNEDRVKAKREVSGRISFPNSTMTKRELKDWASTKDIGIRLSCKQLYELAVSRGVKVIDDSINQGYRTRLTAGALAFLNVREG